MTKNEDLCPHCEEYTIPDELILARQQLTEAISLLRKVDEDIDYDYSGVLKEVQNYLKRGNHDKE